MTMKLLIGRYHFTPHDAAQALASTFGRNLLANTDPHTAARALAATRQDFP